MSLNWNVKGMSVEGVKSAIETAAGKIGLPSFAKIVWEKEELCVIIDKAGKSEFRMCLKQNGDSINISETKRNISFMHKPFVAKVESVVAQVLSSIGANKN